MSERRDSLTEVWRVELSRGLQRLAEGDIAQAEGHFTRAYHGAPERPEVCFALGRERLRQGKLEEAERLLRTAWSSSDSSGSPGSVGSPPLAAAAAALARCLGVVGRRPEEAHAVLDEAQTRLGDEPGLFVVRAELLLEQERADDAFAALEHARDLLDRDAREAPATRDAINTGLARAGNLKGIQLGREGRREEALFSFKRAFDLEPTWSGPLVNMGAIFAQLGRAARARACYERALVLDPHNPITRYNLANLFRDRADLTAAAAEYRHVLDLEPSYPGARVALAECLMDLGRVSESIELLTAALAETPDDVNLTFHLAVAYDLQEDSVLAEHHLRSVLAKDPRHVAALCRLALLAGRLARYLEAAELIRQAREIDAERADAYLAPDAD